MAMNVGSSSSDEPEVMMDINTTPLIDVMLVLIIMLIITIPAQLHSVNLDMPVAATAEKKQDPVVIRLDIDADASLQGKSLEELFAEISKAPKAVRNNGGGHWNHSLFWELLAPADKAGEPSAELAAKIDAELGGLDKFKADFDAAGAGQFGSGWAWLIVQDGKLQVTSTPNQDNPLMDVVEERGEVVLGADVWEHAYYLKYQNRRADYLKSFWTVVNWNKVNELSRVSINTTIVFNIF